MIRFESSFFCLIALIELFKIKKKIVQIGPVDLEIFAKNGFFKYYLVPGGTGSNPDFCKGPGVLWPAIYGTYIT